MRVRLALFVQIHIPTSAPGGGRSASRQSSPQPGAGIVSRAHSQALAGFWPEAGTFSDANLVDNIIWQNRKFFWLNDESVIPAISGLCPDIGKSPLGLTCPSISGDIPDSVTD